MNKLLIAAAAAFFAVTALFGTGAQAGFNVRLGAPAGFSTLQKAGCGGGYRRIFRKHSYRSVSRRTKRKVYAAKKPAAETVSVAKAEETTETAPKTAQSHSSSITTADGEVTQAAKVEADEPAKVAAAEDLGCKQFFPSVGMTLSVPCE